MMSINIKQKKPTNLQSEENVELHVGAHKKYKHITWGYICSGEHHGPRKCPAFGKQYNNCNGLQHFVRRVCNTTTWTKMMATALTMRSEEIF